MSIYAAEDEEQAGYGGYGYRLYSDAAAHGLEDLLALMPILTLISTNT